MTYLKKVRDHLNSPFEIPFTDKSIKKGTLYIGIALVLGILIAATSLSSAKSKDEARKKEEEFQIAQQENEEREKKLQEESEGIEEEDLKDYENREEIREDNSSLIDLGELTEEERSKRDGELNDEDILKSDKEIKDEEIKKDPEQEKLKKQYELQADGYNRTAGNQPQNYTSQQPTNPTQVAGTLNNQSTKNNQEIKNKLDELDRQINQIVNSEKNIKENENQEDISEEIKKQQQRIKELNESIDSLLNADSRVIYLNKNQVLAINGDTNYLITRKDKEIKTLEFIETATNFIENTEYDDNKYSVEEIDEDLKEDLIKRMELIEDE
ncbi:hypothetical protein [uncultured Anaerococcus sp.]|uniref:hypothetical protein n=1 Tax=uncultured Anaerococcus sp. TaxID=293428 RepID=UPI0025F682DC|nr:hypothetical protein [uncultured Anaerococcus sp.]